MGNTVIEGIGRGTAGASRAFRRPLKHSTRDAISACLFLLPNILGFLLFTAGPVIGSLAISFFDWQLLKPPIFTGLANYKTMLFGDTLFYKSLSNTLFFVVVYVPLNIVVSVAMALWLSGNTRGKPFFRLLFFLPILTPAVAVGSVWRFIYQPDFGLIDKILSALGTKGPLWLGDPDLALFAIIIMTVWFQMGWNMVIFIAGIQSIPRDLYESAEIDGVGELRKTFSITIPMISPAIFFGIIMTVISSFQVFDQIYIMAGFNGSISGPMNSTRTIAIHIFENGFSFFKMGYAAACSWALFLIIFLITLLQFRLQKKWVHYDM
jgi:multiple sugar transport system permease protein